MARGKASRECVGCKHAGDRYSERTRRWAERKAEETADRINKEIDLLAITRNRRRAKWQFMRLRKLEADKRKKERELLAKTSLGDLIH